MTPSDTPINITLQSLDKLKALHAAVEHAILHKPMNCTIDAANFVDWIEISIDIKQAIKDAEFEQSLNPLPFPEK